jgi:hypothetical protein
MSFGPDLEALQAHKAISETYSAAERTRLDSPIENLWQRRNFRRENRIGGITPLIANLPEPPLGAITDIIYERMKPALQLASLSHNVSHEFLVKILRAKVVTRWNMPLLDDNFADANDIQAYRTMPALLSEKMRIYMGFIQEPRCRHSNGKCSSFPSDQLPVYLQIHGDYLDWYSRPDYNAQDMQKKNAIACNLAVTLVHEHAHAVWQMRNHAIWTARVNKMTRILGAAEAGGRAYEAEPYHSEDDCESELGISWERY